MCEQFPVWQAAWDELQRLDPHAPDLLLENRVGTALKPGEGMGILTPERYQQILERDIRVLQGGSTGCG